MKALEHLDTRHHGRALQSSSPHRCVARTARDLLADPSLVSDTASVNAAADLSGPAIAEILAAVEEHGSRAVRVFPPDANVLVSFADRLANEVVSTFTCPK